MPIQSHYASAIRHNPDQFHRYHPDNIQKETPAFRVHVFPSVFHLLLSLLFAFSLYLLCFEDIVLYFCDIRQDIHPSNMI